MIPINKQETLYCPYYQKVKCRVLLVQVDNERLRQKYSSFTFHDSAPTRRRYQKASEGRCACAVNTDTVLDRGVVFKSIHVPSLEFITETRILMKMKI